MAAHSLTFFLREEVTVCPSLESRWALGLLDQESTTVPASELGPWDSDRFYFPSIGWEQPWGPTQPHKEADMKQYQVPASSQPMASTSLPSMWVNCLEVAPPASRERPLLKVPGAERGHLPDHRFTGKINVRCYLKLLDVWVDCHTAIGKAKKEPGIREVPK